MDNLDDIVLIISKLFHVPKKIVEKILITYFYFNFLQNTPSTKISIPFLGEIEIDDNSNIKNITLYDSFKKEINYIKSNKPEKSYIYKNISVMIKERLNL